MPTATPEATSVAEETLRAHEAQLAELQTQVRRGQERLSEVIGVLSKNAKKALEKAEKKSAPRAAKKQTTKKAAAKKSAAAKKPAKKSAAKKVDKKAKSKKK